MRPSLVRTGLVTAGSLLASLLVATPALAQRSGDYVECFRDGRRVDCESVSRDRERARALEQARVERALARDATRRAEEARTRALEQARQRVRDQEWRRAEERRREADRMRDARRALEASRLQAAARRPRYEDYRPRITLGGGGDMRRFGDVNRYLVHAGVDFHAFSGLGMRPEVIYAWSDRQTQTLPTAVCPACATFPANFNSVPAELRSRNQMLGINLNATYAFMRGSFIRPYLIGGAGVFSTRETVPEIATQSPLATNSQIALVTYRAVSHDRVDLGLNAGSGLEFGRGPVRLYTEFRYFLNDTATPRGFSGMLPITVGLRF